MSKLALFLCGALAGVLVMVPFLFRGSTPTPFGISTTESNFSSQTTTQVTCSATNVTTSLLAARIRASVVIENASNFIVDICRSTSICSTTSSFIALPAVSSNTALSRFVQEDNYTGLYLCRARTSDGVVNVSSAP